MQSHQETVLEQFLQRSFGAPFLYEPRIIRRGKNGNIEPADLAWIDQDHSFVALFYMHESIKDLDKQIDHNAKQAYKYLRLWSTRGASFGLRGVNRYKDETYVPFNHVRSLMCFYVVSCACGVEVRANFDTGIPSATLCIPDRLIHKVAEFGGTIVDLLLIVEMYLKGAAALPTDNDERFELLISYADRYARDAIVKADPDLKFLSKSVDVNFPYILEHVSRLRMSPSLPILESHMLGPLPAGSTATYSYSAMKMTPTEARCNLARVFGDLSLAEYYSLAAMASEAVRESALPGFAKPVLLVRKDLHYPIVCSCSHAEPDTLDPVKAAADAAATTREAQAAIAAARSDNGAPAGLMMFYTDMPGRDYRIPLALGVPPSGIRPHAHILVHSIVQLAGSMLDNS